MSEDTAPSFSFNIDFPVFVTDTKCRSETDKDDDKEESSTSLIDYIKYGSPTGNDAGVGSSTYLGAADVGFPSVDEEEEREHRRAPHDTHSMRTEVLCTTHNKRRLSRYCTKVAVRNAEQRVINYIYKCNADSPCAVGGGDRGGGQSSGKKEANDPGNFLSGINFSGSLAKETKTETPTLQVKEKQDDFSFKDEKSSDSEEDTPVGSPNDINTTKIMKDRLAAATSAEFSPTTGEPNRIEERKNVRRYYDNIMVARIHSREQKKLCWSCGMENHEKYQCWNQICYRCHELMPSGVGGHSCHPQSVAVSPFVLLDLDMLDEYVDGRTVKDTNGKEVARYANPNLLKTRCLRCHKFGHLDCPVVLDGDGKEITEDVSENLEKNDSKTRNLHKNRVPSCTMCAMPGHNGYMCPTRPPRDTWRRNVIASADAMLKGDLIYRKNDSSISDKSTNYPKTIGELNRFNVDRIKNGSKYFSFLSYESEILPRSSQPDYSRGDWRGPQERRRYEGEYGGNNSHYRNESKWDRMPQKRDREYRNYDNYSRGGNERDKRNQQYSDWNQKSHRR